MTSLRVKERDTYEAIWQVPAYAANSPGAQLAGLFQDLTGATKGDTVLDAGCGAGAGAIALRDLGLHVTLCDITEAGLPPDLELGLPFYRAELWQNLRLLLGQRHWVFCADVLEHIPTALVGLVVSRLLEVSTRGVFLSISHVPDTHGVWVGTQLHQTVQPFTWWRELLGTLGTLVHARDLLHFGIFVVKPAC